MAGAAVLSSPMVWPDCTVTDVHDGDTVTVDINLGRYLPGRDSTLGFHLYIVGRRLHLRNTVRLYGLNVPELATPAGKAARDALLTRMPVGSRVQLTTWLNRNDKYGRVLAAIDFGGDVNRWLIDNGHAVAWDGTGPKPTPAGEPPVNPASAR